MQGSPTLTWVGNGRHRLWATLPHFGHWQVPLRSGGPLYANPADQELTDWPGAFVELSDEMRRLRWFNHNDPMNRRLENTIAIAACGYHPRLA